MRRRSTKSPVRRSQPGLGVAWPRGLALCPVLPTASPKQELAAAHCGLPGGAQQAEPGLCSKPSPGVGAGAVATNAVSEDALEVLQELHSCGLSVSWPVLARGAADGRNALGLVPEQAQLSASRDISAAAGTTSSGCSQLSQAPAARANDEEAALEDLLDLHRCGLRVVWPS